MTEMLQVLLAKHTAAEAKQILYERGVKYASDKLIVKWKRAPGASSMHAASQQTDVLSAMGLRSLHTSEQAGVQVLGISAEQDVLKRVMQLQQHDLVEYAEPDYVVHATELAPYMPNDADFSSLWYVQPSPKGLHHRHMSPLQHARACEHAEGACKSAVVCAGGCTIVGSPAALRMRTSMRRRHGRSARAAHTQWWSV